MKRILSTFLAIIMLLTNICIVSASELDINENTPLNYDLEEIDDELFDDNDDDEDEYIIDDVEDELDDDIQIKDDLEVVHRDLNSLPQHNGVSINLSLINESIHSSFDIGYAHSMLVLPDGSLWGWGSNSNRQLGDGSSAQRNTPIKIMEDVVSVSADDHTMAIKSDGSLWGWGNNTNGRVGIGSTTALIPTPQKVMDNVAIISASNSGNHTMAIKNDGSLWGWGYKGDGQLGDSTTVEKRSPIKIMDDVAFVSAGGYHTNIIKEDGSLWAWGRNNHGQTGSATSSTPVLVMDDVIFIASGLYHNLEIRSDNSLWAWVTIAMGS